MIFTRARVAVFVDGCYWHGCPQHYVPARTNASYWSAKIAGNTARDRETDLRLAALGWHVIRVWEHDDPDESARCIRDAVAANRHRDQLNRKSRIRKSAGATASGL